MNQYYINISYIQPHLNGQQLVNVNGVTQSMPTYSIPYFIANMPEVKISATGSSQIEALTNLMLLSGSASNTGNEPLSGIRNW